MASRQRGQASQAPASPLYDQYVKFLYLGQSLGDNATLVLKECEKRLKKQPKNASLLLWKAEILSDLNRHEEMRSTYHSLCTLSPPIQEGKFLACINESMNEREGAHGKGRTVNSNGEASVRLWRRAINESPKASKTILATIWFWNSVQMECFDDALEAAKEITVREDTPKWRAFKSVIYVLKVMSRMENGASEEARFELAFTGDGKNVKALLKSPIGEFEAKESRELRLIFEICLRSTTTTELSLKGFNAWNPGLDGDMNQSESTFKKMMILAQLQLWDELWQYCSTLMAARGPLAQELMVWKYLFQAAFKSVKSDGADKVNDERIKQSMTLLYKHHEKDPKSRSVKKMPLDLGLPYLGLPQPILDCLVSYFDDFKDQYCCFEDLRAHFQRSEAISSLDDERNGLPSLHLSDEDKDALLCHISETKPFNVNDFRSHFARSSDSIRTRLNVLKFIYLLHVSTSTDTETLELFALEAIRFYRSFERRADVDKKAFNPEEDDAGILAVMALLKLQRIADESGSNSAQSHLIQAVCLLERLLLNSPYNYDVLHLSVKIYLHLGLGSMAIGSYHMLRIKESLIDAFGHLLFTRISIQHPFMTKSHARKNAKFDPHEELLNNLDYYRKAIKQTNKFLGGNPNETYADVMLEFRDLKKRLQWSFSRRMFALERRRVARFTGKFLDKDSYLYELKDEWAETREIKGENLEQCKIGWRNMADSRDFKAMPNYEATEDSYLIQLLRGSKSAPGEYWLNLFTHIEQLAVLATEQKPLPGFNLVALELDPTKHDELTEWEQCIALAWMKLRPLIYFVTAYESNPSLKELPTEARTQLVTTSIQDWLKENPAETFSPSEKDLLPVDVQSLFLRLEYLITCSRLSQFALKQANDPKHHLAPFKNEFKQIFLAVMQYHVALRKFATDWRNALSEKGKDLIVGMIRGDGEERTEGAKELAVKLEDVIKGNDGLQLEQFAENMVASAQETLDGFLMVKKL